MRGAIVLLGTMLTNLGALPVFHDSRPCRNRNRGRQTIAAKFHFAYGYDYDNDNDKDKDKNQGMLPANFARNCI
jgi:hypothetical protein